MFRLKKTTLFFSLLFISLLTIAFLLFNKPSNPDLNQTDQVLSLSQPVVSIETILATSDVRRVLRELAEFPDVKRLEEWQQQILQVATEAGHQEDNLGFLTGPQGLHYLTYRGKRLWFEEAVQSAYLEGDNDDELYARFPEAEDLFSETRQLFQQRDALIDSISQTLIESSQTQDQEPLTASKARAAALSIWQERNK